MRNLIFHAAVAACFTTLAAAQGGEREVRQLFDGVSLAGWEGDPRFWSVVEGAIVGESTPDNPCRRTTYLCWTGEEFSDFEFSCRFRIEGGNSGVQFRSQRGEDWQLSGYQADIEDGPSWTGCLYEQNGRGVLVRRGESLTTRPEAESVRTRFADDEAVLAAFRPGDWNEYRIRALGPRIVISLNGVESVVLEDRDPHVAASRGVFGLQLHAGGPMRVAFTDLTLEVLPPADERAPGTRWVFAEEGGPRTYLRREFELRGEVVQASLRGAADNHLRVWLNGREVLACDEWWVPQRVELEPLAFAERNALAAELLDDDTFGAGWLELRLEFASGEVQLIGTDEDWLAAVSPDDGWQAPGFDDSAWREPKDFGGPEAEPWLSLGPMMRNLPLGGLAPVPMDAEEFELEEFFDVEFEIHIGPPAEIADDGSARWIWPTFEQRDGERAWFRRAFSVPDGSSGLRLFGVCDNEVQVFVDGELVASGDDWTRPFELTLEPLAPGWHVISAVALNTGGPAAMLLELTGEVGGQRRRLVGTDGSWQARVEEPPAGWHVMDDGQDGWDVPYDFGSWLNSGYGQPAGRSSGRPGVADPADSIEVREGFEIDLVYSVPKDSQGSWVAITFDDRGRLIASDQYGALWRVILPPPGAEAVEPMVEKLDVEIGQAQGLCHAFDSLYVVVAQGDGRGLYRLRDKDGDDRFELCELLTPLDGAGEHGPHAVVPDPDGQHLLVIAGNHTALPPAVERSRPTRAWDEDQLLPRQPDARGHAAGVLAPGGWLARVEPDGTGWELIAIGMRNAYDVAVHPSGELFTFDSDMEWDIGLPWYRPTRVLHMTSGAEFGWRHGSGKWPAYYEDSLPAVLDMGQASPTGVLFGTEARFHAPWRDALLIADWTYGKVHAVFFEPDGASWSARSEIFLAGKPFQVTDMAVGPDGCLYLTTGGRRTQSGLYRLQSTIAVAERPVAGEPSEAALLRRRIERMHGDPSAIAAADVGPLVEALAHADRYVRYAARVALEQASVADWLPLALADPRSRVVSLAVIAAARLSAAPRERLLAALEALEWSGADRQDRLTQLRAYQLVLARMGAAPEPVRARLATRFAAYFPSSDAELDRELIRLLVFLQSPLAAEAGLERMREAATQEEGLFYAFTLRTLRAGWSLELRRSWFDWVNQVASGFRGGASVERYIDNMRADAVDALSAEERAALGPLLDGHDVSAAEPSVNAEFVQAWTRAELDALLATPLAGQDFERGRAAYEKARCLECHRIGLAGGGTGPDLTGAAGRFSLTDLLTTIHDPSDAISDQYQDTEIRTHDGRILVGRVVDESGETLVIQSAPPNEERVELQLDEIELRRLHPLSRMPAGLLDVLTPEEVRDLIAYILADGEAAAAFFQ